MSGAKVKLFPGSTPSDGETEELDLRKMGWPATHRPSFACCSSKMASRAAAMSLVFGAATRVPSMASALVALAALAALAAPARAKRGPRVLGVLAAETCTWAPDATGGTLELVGVRLSQAFSEAPRRGAAEVADAAALAAAFVKRRRRRRKNVAVTAWSPGAGAGAPASPVYLVGALAGAEAGAEAGAGGAPLRLRLEQAPAQAQASRPPAAGEGAAPGALPARSCSAFLDPTICDSESI